MQSVEFFENNDPFWIYSRKVNGIIGGSEKTTVCFLPKAEMSVLQHRKLVTLLLEKLHYYQSRTVRVSS